MLYQIAQSNPKSLSTHDILQLQRSVGNRAVKQLLGIVSEPTLTPKAIQPQSQARKEILQLDRVSTRIGSQTVTANRNHDHSDTLAFLAPGKGQKRAPVHLTKKITHAGANLIDAGNLTHGGLNAQNAVAPDYHLTLTSGFMTAILANSFIKRYIVKHGRATQIWGYQAHGTKELSQNKLTANQIVSAFNTDLGIAAGATFDNLLFNYDPHGHGPTFDAVVNFHESVKLALFAIPNVVTGAEVPLGKIKYAHMRSDITAGANALAGQWSSWANNGPVAQRNDFRMPADKWSDLAKALNILNRIRAKALRLENPHVAPGVLFDDHFVDAHLVAHHTALAAVKAIMANDRVAHAAEY